MSYKKWDGCKTGACWSAPCVCMRTMSTEGKIIRPTPQERPDGLLIRARTVLHLMRCYADAHLGRAKIDMGPHPDNRENWGDMWSQRNRVSFGPIRGFGTSEPDVYIDGIRRSERYC